MTSSTCDNRAKLAFGHAQLMSTPAYGDGSMCSLFLNGTSGSLHCTRMNRFLPDQRMLLHMSVSVNHVLLMCACRHFFVSNVLFTVCLAMDNSF